MLPEYGLAYVKNVHFYRSQNGQEEERSADLIVAACKSSSQVQGEPITDFFLTLLLLV